MKFLKFVSFYYSLHISSNSIVDHELYLHMQDLSKMIGTQDIVIIQGNEEHSAIYKDVQE